MYECSCGSLYMRYRSMGCVYIYIKSLFKIYDRQKNSENSRQYSVCSYVHTLKRNASKMTVMGVIFAA